MTDRDLLRERLIAEEDLRLGLYRDTKGQWTIGVGHNLSVKGITRATALFILDEDLDEILADIARVLPWTADLPSPAFRAIVEIGFNAGLDGLLLFRKMLSAAHAHDFLTAGDEILRSELAPSRRQRLAALMQSAASPGSVNS